MQSIKKYEAGVNIDVDKGKDSVMVSEEEESEDQMFKMLKETDPIIVWSIVVVVLALCIIAEVIIFGYFLCRSNGREKQLNIDEIVPDMPKETLNETDGKTKTMETNHAAKESDFGVVVGGADKHEPDASNNTVLSHESQMGYAK